VVSCSPLRKLTQQKCPCAKTFHGFQVACFNSIFLVFTFFLDLGKRKQSTFLGAGLASDPGMGHFGWLFDEAILPCLGFAALFTQEHCNPD
jgi:hypothetical protein